MKMRLKVLVPLGLLLLAATWSFWPRGGDTPSPGQAPATPAAIAAVVAPVTTNAAPASNAVAISRSVASTNRVALRLSNTARTLDEMTVSPRAILLENALVDTAAKLELKIPKHLRAANEPGAFIVQAKGPVTAAFRAALQAAGAEIVSYIPNNAYLVQLSRAGAGALAGHALVQAVLPYEPYFKVQATLLGRAVEQKPLPEGQVLTLGLFAGGAAATMEQIENLGGRILVVDRSPFGPVVRVRPAADWLALAQLPGVQRVEPATRRVAANDLSRAITGVATDSVVATNYLGLTGNNVLVAVMDTGVDVNHPDLTGRVFMDSAGSGFDTDGHGTHVAGIIAGNGSQSTTVTNAQGSIMPGTNGQFRGKAPAAKLFSVGGVGAQGGVNLVNFADRIGVGGNDTNTITSFTNFFLPGASLYLSSFSLPFTFQPGAFPDWYFQEASAVTNALISNLSWNNGGSAEYDLSAASYDAAVRDALPGITGPQPVLFVVAAGNRGGGNEDGTRGVSDTILSPATAKNVITVGALEQDRGITNTFVPFGSTNASDVWFYQSDSSSQVAAYSSRGNVGIGTEGTYGRFKPDVVAPGSFVVSTRSTTWDTQAYYNPTNRFANTLNAGQLVDVGDFNVYTMPVPSNTVGIVLRVVPNRRSPTPFPTLAFFVTANNYAGLDPSDPASYDFAKTNNTVTIPPDGNLQSFLNSGEVSCAVTVGTNTIPVDYDLIMEIVTTNSSGTFLTSLSNLNDSLGQYYRYESGTSMAAADVSGVLALMQDYFTNTLQITPSPALLKAMLINGARIYGNYGYALTNALNLEGWGLVNLPNSLPAGLTAGVSGTAPMFFVDQSPANVLSTGDSRTYNLTVPSDSTGVPLRVTLTWTDPPGNPAAAIKLVNNLDLVVSNAATGEFYVGNSFGASGSPFSVAFGTNSTPVFDAVNNIENVVVPPLLGTNYTVTIIGRGVNVNAVTLEQTNIVQDFALVVSCLDGGVTNGLAVAAAAPALVPATVPLITGIGATNGILFNQIAGANAPWLSTNAISIDYASGFGTNASLYIGQTNQWHFYVVTNTTTFSNAAFVTFLPSTLALPRQGVFADSETDATVPEADLDLFVTKDGTLTNLNPVAISNCIYKVNGAQASLARGGTKFLVYSNSAQNNIYYVGVKNESQLAAEYGFLALFSEQPFSSEDSNGNTIVNAQNVPLVIPDGSNRRPGINYAIAIAIPSDPTMTLRNVIVSNTVTHDNFGDLVGILSHDTTYATLHNHEDLGAVTGQTMIYNDGVTNETPGSQFTAGPGSLSDFRTLPGIGVWVLTEMDDAPVHVGQIDNMTLILQPHIDLEDGTFAEVDVPPGGWFYDYLQVPVGCTNIFIEATNISLVPILTPPVQLYLNYETEPTSSNYLVEADLNQGSPPGNSISYGPPVVPGFYYIGLFNPDPVNKQTIRLRVTLSLNASAITEANWEPGGSLPLLDDAVTNSYLFINDTDRIQGVNVGLRVDHERISDLVFHLISPDGTRYLLMENRGGQSTNGCGTTVIITNMVNVSATGGAQAQTNVINVGMISGTFPITYNFYTAPDQMTVYYGNVVNPANLIYDSGLTNNPPDPNLPAGPQNTLPRTIYINFPPAGVPATSSDLTIVINQFGNTNPVTQWTYTAGGILTNHYYLAFTENTNLTTTPIKYAVPPFVPAVTNYSLIQTNLGLIPTNVVVLAGPVINTNNGHFYYLLSSNNWTTSEQWAVALGGHLATIDDAVEDNWVFNTFGTIGGTNRNLWIGLWDTNNDATTVAADHATNFVWVSGSTVTYTNWYPGEPNNGGGGTNNYEYYGFIDHFYGGQWQDGQDLAQLPGKLEPQFGVVEVEATTATNNYVVAANLYYQPEESLESLIGTSPYGEWTLEILDNRAGATNNANLVSWSLNFAYANTNYTTGINTNPFIGPITNYIPGGALQWYLINVPTNADISTNALLFASLPLQMWWSTNQPPTITNLTDVQLLNNSTGGSVELYTNSTPAFITPGGWYYLGIQNTNVAGANYALNVTFHLFGVLGAPSVVTLPATDVNFTNAMLNGSVNPNGLPATAWFEYGLTTNYTDVAGYVSLTTNLFTSQAFSLGVSNLAPGTVYHFRAVATNSLGTNYGADLTFITALPAFAQTLPATVANGSNAQLNGFASPNGSPTVAWFEFGSSTNYGYQSPPVGVGSGSGVVFVTNRMTGLTVNQAYHFRLAVSNLVGVVYGFDQIFDQANVVAWGADSVGQTVPIPPVLTNLVVGIGAGKEFSLAVNSDGTVVVWGSNSAGQTNVPTGLNNAVAVDGGEDQSVALRSDRTVVAWGGNLFNKTNVPASLTNAVAVTTGRDHCIALRDDGTMTNWGANYTGQANVAGKTNFVAVAAGWLHTIGLKNDGTVEAWGDNFYGQTSVPAGLTNVVAVAAGYYHNLALKRDGTVVGWGLNDWGQANGAGLSNIIAIAAGSYHSLALKSDGKVVQWGDSSAGQLTAYPTGLSNVVAIAAGGFHSLALTSLFGLNQTNVPPFWTNGLNGSTVAMNEMTTNVISNVATDSNTPPQLLQYALLNAPAWASIDFLTGSITLTPGETNGPGTNVITTIVTDNGFPALSATNSFTLVVREVNLAPSLTLPPDTNIVSLAAWSAQATATDPDIPVNTLAFALISGPSNLTVSVAGVIDWTPSAAQAGTNIITIRVTDTNPPAVNAKSLSATGSFTIVVTNAPVPIVTNINIGSIIYTNNGFLLTWFAPSNYLFQVQWTDNLAPQNWQTFTNPAYVSYNTNFPASATNATFTFFDDGSQAPFTGMRFYRLLLVTNAPNVAPVFTLGATATRFVTPTATLTVTNDATDANAGQTLLYALVSPPVGINIDTNTGVITWTNVPLALAGTTNNTITTIVTDNGTPALSATNVITVWVNPIPSLTSVTFGTNGTTLQWSGWTNEQFQVQWTTNLAPPSWTLFPDIITSTNGAFVFVDTNLPLVMKFYQLILLP